MDPLTGRARPPSGWIQLTLGELCDVITDGTHHTPNYVPRGVPFYSVENVTNDDFVNVKQITLAEHRKLIQRCRPERWDILMTRIGSLADTKLIDWDVDASIYVSLALLRPSKLVDARYLYAFTKSHGFVKAVEDRSLLWAAPKKINIGDISGVPILLPNKRSEQKAIADVVLGLEDHEKALARLLTKKEAVKHGLTQELLSGKSRLEGFSEPWEEIRLGNHVTYLTTVALSRAQLDLVSPLRYLHYGDIHTSTRVALDAAHQTMPRVSAILARKATRLQIGDLVFADASEDPAGVGKSVEIVSVPPEGVVSGLHTIAARFDKSVLADGFKSYLQFIPAFRAALLRLAAGTKVLATTRGSISSVSLLMPGVEEQQAIAGILSAADTEIYALESLLRKVQSIRQGIVEQLLTGRTRLPVREDAK